jgi:hypothetical protein
MNRLASQGARGTIFLLLGIVLAPEMATAQTSCPQDYSVPSGQAACCTGSDPQCFCVYCAVAATNNNPQDQIACAPVQYSSNGTPGPTLCCNSNSLGEPYGDHCSHSSDCCLGSCEPVLPDGGSLCCGPQGEGCGSADAGWLCAPVGEHCSVGPCCGGSCSDGGICCLNFGDQTCHADSDCCQGGHCDFGTGTCTQNCTTNIQCANFYYNGGDGTPECINNSCCVTDTSLGIAACKFSSDCCSNTKQQCAETGPTGTKYCCTVINDECVNDNECCGAELLYGPSAATAFCNHSTSRAKCASCYHADELLPGGTEADAGCCTHISATQAVGGGQVCCVELEAPCFENTDCCGGKGATYPSIAPAGASQSDVICMGGNPGEGAYGHCCVPTTTVAVTSYCTQSSQCCSGDCDTTTHMCIDAC